MTLRLLGSIPSASLVSRTCRVRPRRRAVAARQPQTAEPTSAVDVPQYAEEEDDDAPDPAAEAHARAWGDYQHQVFTSLKASSDPRDWAVAASFNLLLPSATDPQLKATRSCVAPQRLRPTMCSCTGSCSEARDS